MNAAKSYSAKLTVLAASAVLTGCLSSDDGSGPFTNQPDDGGSNTAPVISGNPPSSVAVGAPYSFSPTASDADGDSLSFSIQNNPSWASFNSSTGSLTGVPTLGDIGSYADIQISVSDGKTSSAMASFSVEVTLSSSNNPPTISGNPPTVVTAGQAYSFTPQASDPDGDSLTFSIQNPPSWASFNNGTGALTGVPDTGDIGLYTGIQISVSDGEFTAPLSSFNVEVTQVATGSTTLNWAPPTLNEDGTTLTDLAGYVISYGTSSGNYTEEILIDNPSITTYVVENLTPGTYYFAAKSFNTANEQSQQFSGELVRDVD